MTDAVSSGELHDAVHGRHHLLICTVGGTPDPIVEAIRHWKPARVIFLPSEDTKQFADIVTDTPGLLLPGSWDMVILADAQDFGGCVRRIRRLDEQVAAWRRKGNTYGVIVDFTGGTKCMSAAVSLVSRRWPCMFSYVGGSERTKGGVGTVLAGQEQNFVTQNPWNALGYQAVEDTCLLFDQRAFTPAAKLLDETRKASDEDSVKRTLSTFHQLCEGYGLWDRFQHKEAAGKINKVLTNAVDLEIALGAARSELAIRHIKQNLDALQQIVDRPQSRTMIADLLANADRRRREGRFDDGVGRLYRAIESIAQHALAERHQIPRTDNVALERIPESLQERWKFRARNGALLLSLQDAYALLDLLGDETGKKFKHLRLHDRESPLTARNHSILAHGFQPVKEKIFESLWNAATELGGFSGQDLPAFPILAPP